MAKSRWYKHHPNNLESIYDYYKRTGDTYGTVQRTYNYLRVPQWKRSTYNCIFARESGFRATVWYGGLTGYQPQYYGTNRVNGTGQLRPAWANGYLAYLDGADGIRYLSDSASDITYHITSDPIASTIISVRIGLNPFIAQAGSCF